MEKNAKIYVAGHRGMVGSAIVRRLREAGYDNFIFRTSSELNLMRQADTEEFFQKEKPDYVFLAAAKVGGILANNIYRAEFLYNNLMIESNVIEAAYRSGVKKLLFLGSSCIYPKMAPQPLREDYLLTGVLEPTNEPYAIAKIAGIKLCEAYRDQYDANFISVMPTNLFGPNDNYDLKKSHVLPALLRKMHIGKCMEEGDFKGIRRNLKQQPVGGEDVSSLSDEKITELMNSVGVFLREEGRVEVEIWGTGSPKREFLHADDLADACFYLMQNYDGKQLVNIGTGLDISIKELAELIKEIVGFKGQLVFDSSKPDGTPRKLMDVSKLHDAGWEHQISLEKGIRKVYEEFEQ